MLAAVLLLAALFRILPAWGFVFPHAGDVRLFEADPWFHIRQAQQIIGHYPSVCRWDTGTHYPSGERGINQGLFEWSVATAAMVVGLGHPSQHLLLLVGCWVPILLALGTVVLLYGMARQLMSAPLAVACCMLYAFMPGSLDTYSMLGFCDNHIAEVFLSLWTCVALVACWRQTLQHELPWWRPAFLGALPVAVFLFTWPGSLVHVAVVGLSLLTVGLFAPDATAVRRTAVCAVRWGLALAVMYFPLAWLFPDLVQWDLTVRMLRPGLLGIVLWVPALLLATVQARWGAHADGASGASPVGSRRALGVFGIGLLIAAMVALAFTRQGHSALDMLLSERSPLVSEQQPVTVLTCWYYYGLEIYVAALGALLAVLAIMRRRLPVEALVGLIYGLIWTSLWIRTYDFIYMPPPFLAFMVVLGVIAISHLVKGDARGALRITAVTVAAIVLLQFVSGPLTTQYPWPTRAQVAALMPMNDGWESAMQWLRTRTPPLPPRAECVPFKDGVSPYPPGSYGVLTSWDYGEYVAFLGQRPATWSESNDSPVSSWLFRDNEEAAWEALRGYVHGRDQAVRYLVLDSRMPGEFFMTEARTAGLNPGQFMKQTVPLNMGGKLYQLTTRNERWDATMLARLYEHDAQSMSHFRLVYETPEQVLLTQCAGAAGPSSKSLSVLRRSLPLGGPQDRLRQLDGAQQPVPTPFGYVYDAKIQATVKIFESVAGAHLVGKAPPGAAIEVSLPLRCGSSGRSWTWQMHTTGLADGSFDVIVPYPTVVSPSDALDVVAQGPYRVAIGGTSGQAVVTESQVQSGASIAVSP